MAFTHGKDSVFKLDNASGSLTDISTYVNNVDFPETADVSETTTLGADNKTEKQFRVHLSKVVATTIKNAFDLLGIKVPERM